MTTHAAEPAGTPQATQLKIIEKRWSKALTKAGWTALPNIVLDKLRIPRDRERRFHGMVNTDSTAT
jgi:hypothetical protein